MPVRQYSDRSDRDRPDRAPGRHRRQRERRPCGVPWHR